MTHERPGTEGQRRLFQTPENFASVLGLQEGEYNVEYERRFLPFSSINVLPQGRKTFDDEGLRLLADDIADKKLLSLPLVATFNGANAEQYLAVINELWGTKFDIQTLTPHIEDDGTQTFNILLAGERRLRACKMILADGRYQAKFGRDDLFVTYATNLPPMEAIFMQASENTYMSIPAHEEAVYYSEMFRVIRMADPEFPLAKFARRVGRSADKVRDALKFTMLPEEIQDNVRNGELSYGVAVEIARLAEAQVGEDMEFYTKRALTGKYQVKEFKKLIDDYFLKKNAGQQSLFEVFTGEQLDAARRNSIRKVVQKEIIFGLWSFIYYFEHVIKLFENGQLGLEDSPFSTGSPVRLFNRLVQTQQRLLPHLEGVLSKIKFIDAREALEALMASSDELAQSVPDDELTELVIRSGSQYQLSLGSEDFTN